MPELPDVEVFAERVRARGLDRRIETVDVRDAERLRGVSAAGLQKALTGQSLSTVHRHGKVLFVRIGETGPQLVIHFGMTGFVALYDDPEDEPEHARLVLIFTDGGRLAYDNQRRLGWIEFADDVDTYLREEGIGPDALDFDIDALQRLLESRRGMIKPALTDQAKIAGIGNIYADEILFQAGVRPDRRTGDLTPAEIEAIGARMHEVLIAAADCGADPGKMPGDWLTPHRGTRDPCPGCGGQLATRKIGGRTAWLCPRCQANSR